MTIPLARLRKGDPLAVARAISAVENGAPGAEQLLREAQKRSGKAHRIGIAGPPGAGKSTLVAGLIGALRARGETVGILATDPSSQLTGGAILGDRVRIRESGEDRGVFYRSMATRGHRGGLARACRDTIRILEASGKGRILVETVGIGQAELDIASIVDTLVLVLVPESGDFIQMLKAGIMELGDVLVVNKCDRPGADDVAADLEEMLDLRAKSGGWRPPVVKAVARDGTGIDAVLAAAERHRAHLAQRGLLEARRLAQAEAELRDRLLDARREEIARILSGKTAVRWVERIASGKATSAEAARSLAKKGAR